MIFHGAEQPTKGGVESTICHHAIMISLPGGPGVYFHSLSGEDTNNLVLRLVNVTTIDKLSPLNLVDEYPSKV